MTSDPHLIVLTGGPCSGKSASVPYLRAELEARGWTVLTPPEAATLLMYAGVDFPALAGDRQAYTSAQAHLMALQRDLRERFAALARDLPGDRKVVLFDRAEPDTAAYTSDREYADLIAAHGGHGQTAGRYDAVLHLVTAADGAADSYTLANNTTRVETPEQAIALDRATLRSWLGHPHLVVIGNDTDFPGKLRRVLRAVLNVVGDPDPVEDERKYLLSAPPSAADLAAAGAVPVEISQAYLPGPAGVEVRLRSRRHGAHTEFFLTHKSPRPDGSRVERERRIDHVTYDRLAAERLPGTRLVTKTRWCVVHAGQHLEIDHLHGPVEAWLVEAELIEPQDRVVLPGWLGAHTDVTADPAWRNAALSRR